jgi:hypothetical protein
LLIIRLKYILYITFKQLFQVTRLDIAGRETQFANGDLALSACSDNLYITDSISKGMHVSRRNRK